MICNNCGNEIKWVRLDNSSNAYKINECECGSKFIFVPQDKDTSNIMCPFCNQYPFKQNVASITNWKKVVCEINDEI